MLLIENVGNLVCPALFDLGERAKVAILSVTEGEDKPLKYPHMFRAADVLILNKIDLLPHVDFDVALAIGNALRVNPKIATCRVSARTGEGPRRLVRLAPARSRGARGGGAGPRPRVTMSRAARAAKRGMRSGLAPCKISAYS